MSDRISANCYEQESHGSRQHAESSASHQPSSSDDTSYTTPMLNDRHLEARGNSVLRAAALRRAQQTHGNRAVQRAIHFTATTLTLPNEEVVPAVSQESQEPPVQRDIPQPTVGKPTAVQRDTGKSSGQPTGAGSGSGAVPQVPPQPKPPGPNASDQQLLEYQQQIEKYNRLMTMITNLMQMQHERKKSIVNNFRA